jgi:hypothetical protein
MKLALSLFLALVLLTESLLPKGAGLSQDFKFGEMMAHFQEHKKSAESAFDFLDFFWMHYDADSLHKKQNHHDNLPCLDGHSLLTTIQLPIKTIEFYTHFVAILIEETNPLVYLNSYHFLYALDLLNPPQ